MDRPTGASQPQIYCPEDCKLCADSHPAQNGRKRLLPFKRKAAGEAFLVGGILMVERAVSGAHSGVNEPRNSSAAEQYFAFLAEAAQLAVAPHERLAGCSQVRWHQRCGYQKTSPGYPHTHLLQANQPEAWAGAG